MIIIRILSNIYKSNFMLYLPSFNREKQQQVTKKFVLKVYFEITDQFYWFS